MKSRILLLLIVLTSLSCEDSSENYLKYTPAQLARLLSGNDSEGKSWFRNKEQAGGCAAFDQLYFTPLETAENQLLLQTHLSSPCGELDSLIVSFPAIIGSQTTNLIQFKHGNDSVTQEISLLTSELFTVSGSYLTAEDGKVEYTAQ